MTKVKEEAGDNCPKMTFLNFRTLFEKESQFAAAESYLNNAETNVCRIFFPSRDQVADGSILETRTDTRT